MGNDCAPKSIRQGRQTIHDPVPLISGDYVEPIPTDVAKVSMARSLTLALIYTPEGSVRLSCELRSSYQMPLSTARFSEDSYAQVIVVGDTLLSLRPTSRQKS